ncbi:MAG: hypothetical protein AAGD12_06855 [Pseudomonadota bacterium]
MRSPISGGGLDLIDLTTIDADTGAIGDQAFAFIGVAGFSDSAGELRSVVGPGGNTRIQGDTDGDRLADLDIRKVGAFTH